METLLTVLSFPLWALGIMFILSIFGNAKNNNISFSRTTITGQKYSEVYSGPMVKIVFFIIGVLFLLLAYAMV